jgi:poly [ADP-ribose] polymerase
MYRDDGSLVRAPNGFDSVLARGTQSPNPLNDVTISIDGKHVIVPQGPVVKDNTISSSFSQNEVILHTTLLNHL